MIINTIITCHRRNNDYLYYSLNNYTVLKFPSLHVITLITTILLSNSIFIIVLLVQ